MPPDEKLRVVRNWFLKAESDFKNIDIVLVSDNEDLPFDTVCFHAQQAAEKYIKGYLVFLGIPLAKTHDLEELISLIDDEEIKRDIGKLTGLTQFAVVSRYPDDIEDFDRETAESAVDKAHLVQSVILKTLEKQGVEI